MMSLQRFHLYNSMGHRVPGFALGAYRPLNIKKDGEKIKNPAFDNHSQQILNLKFPEKGNYFNPAVSYCATNLATFLGEEIKVQFAEFVIVPSSGKGNISAGLEKVVQMVCRLDKRFTYQGGALGRHKTIEKLAKGGDRSLHVHLNSLTYKVKPGSPSVKILLDDVMTSGNSLTGAMTVMEQVAAGLTIVPVVLGKTTHD